MYYRKRRSRRGNSPALTTNQASDSVHGKIPGPTAHQKSGDRQGSALAQRTSQTSGGANTSAATNPTDSKEQGDTSVRTARKTSDNRDKSREIKDTHGVLIVKHLERTWYVKLKTGYC